MKLSLEQHIKLLSDLKIVSGAALLFFLSITAIEYAIGSGINWVWLGLAFADGLLVLFINNRHKQRSHQKE